MGSIKGAQVKKNTTVRAELIHWLAKYDSKLKNGNPPMVSDTVDGIVGIVYKQVKKG